MSASRPSRSPWHVLIATSIGVVAVFVNISGLSVALPTMTRELNASAAQANWILVSYMLVTTALILVFGRIADMLGRRPVYVAGLTVFTLATLACALSGTAEMLIAARIVQAVGAAAIVTNTTAILTDAFPADTLGRGLGWNAAVAAIGQMIGPVVGGVATSWWGWTGLFWICVPLGLCALIGSFLVVPARAVPAAREPFDAVGAVLSTGALTLAVFALTPGIFGDGRPWAPWTAGGLAFVVFAAFLVVQGRRRYPMVDLSLFRDRTCATLYAAVLLNAVGQYALVLLASLYVQATQNADPLTAGLLVGPAAVGTLLAASGVGSLVNRVQPQVLSATGMALIVLGASGFATALTDGPSPPLLMGVSLFLVGFGTGTFMTPSTSALMLVVPEERRGVANGVRSALQNVGFLVSTAIALAVATAGLSSDARRAAYGGTLTTMGGDSVSTFVVGVRVAAIVLAVVAALGVVVCASLPKQRIGARVGPNAAVRDENSLSASA